MDILIIGPITKKIKEFYSYDVNVTEKDKISSGEARGLIIREEPVITSKDDKTMDIDPFDLVIINQRDNFITDICKEFHIPFIKL